MSVLHALPQTRPQLTDVETLNQAVAFLWPGADENHAQQMVRILAESWSSQGLDPWTVEQLWAEMEHPLPPDVRHRLHRHGEERIRAVHQAREQNWVRLEKVTPRLPLGAQVKLSIDGEKANLKIISIDHAQAYYLVAEATQANDSLCHRIAYEVFHPIWGP